MNFTSSQHYREVQITSGIFLALVSLAAAVGNGLLLVTIWKDPFKTFRTPTTFFIIGLAVADFLTGIIVCPIQASLSIAGYIGIKRNSLIFPFLQKAASVATFISLITMNSSYIILLSLTWSQFLAISSPHKHKALVTKRRAKASLISTWAYTIAFAVLYASGVEKTVLFKVDLYVHTTGSLLLLTIAYFCLYKAFKRHMRRLHSLRENNLSRVNRRQRQFTIVNLLLLMFVIVCTLPITVVSYLHIYHTESNAHPLKMKIAHLLSCNMLFLKFALDPLIYAWRLTQYRQALKSLVTCRRHRIQIDDVISHSLDNQTLNTPRCHRPISNRENVDIDQSMYGSLKSRII